MHLKIIKKWIDSLKVDLAPLCENKEACLQFLFDEGLLKSRMLCTECNALLDPIKRRGRMHPEFCCRRVTNGTKLRK